MIFILVKVGLLSRLGCGGSPSQRLTSASELLGSGCPMGETGKRLLLDATVWVSDTAAHERVLQRFAHHGYQRHDAGLTPETIATTSIPDALGPLSTDRPVAVVTNVLTYAFAWYRTWNAYLEGLVLELDIASPAFSASPSDPLTAALADCIGIEAERLQGKVYLDLTLSNANRVVDLFRQARFLRNIDALEAFPFEKNSSASELGPTDEEWVSGDGLPYRQGRDAHPYLDVFRLEKLSHEGGFRETTAQPWLEMRERKRYRFGDVVVEGGPGKALPEVRLDAPTLFAPSLGDRVCEHAPRLAPHLVAGVQLSQDYNFLQKHQVFRGVLEPLVALFPETAEGLARQLLPLMEHEDVHRKIRPVVAFDLAMVTKRPEVLEAFADLAEREYAGTELDFPAFTVVNFIEKWFQIVPHRSYFMQQQKALRRIVAAHREEVLPQVSVPASRTSKRLLILIGEADTVRYGPIQAGFGMARMIQQQNPDWTIAIMVTDRHRLDQHEVCYPNIRPTSARWEKELRAELDGTGVELMLAPPGQGRINRLTRQLEQARSWRPELVLSVDDDRDILRGLLFPDYPIIEVHVGSLVVKPDDADLYLSIFDEETRGALFERLEVPLEVQEKCATFMGTVEFGVAQRTHCRAEHNLPEEAFLLGVVGYDLEFALRDEVLEMMVALLDAEPRLQLVFAGCGTVRRVVNRFSAEHLKRSHFLERVADLTGFLKLLDGLFCPRRRGGGFSHCTAMAEGVPTVVERFDEGDVTLSAGKAFALEDLEACAQAITALMADGPYRETLRQRGIEAMARRKAISDSAVERLFSFFPLAKARFDARRRVSKRPSKRPPKRNRQEKKRSKRSRQHRR